MNGHMGIVKGLAGTAILLLTLSGFPAKAENLSLSIGDAPFEFRLNGCADLSGAQVTAMSSGIVGSGRRSLPLRVTPAQTRGAYEVAPQVAEGIWIVTITATCQADKAGAILQVADSHFVREKVQQFSRPPSPEEVDAALKTYASSFPSDR